MQALASAVTSRAQLQSKLGLSYEGDRNLYTALGYPTSLSFARYNSRFARQDVARRVITAFPEATWKTKPIIRDDLESKQSAFEKAVKELVDDHNLYHYLYRLDILSRIGQYGVMLLGLSGTANDKALKNPVFEKRGKKGHSLLYLQPYSQEHASITKLVKEVKDERFGLPELYDVTVSVETSNISGVTSGRVVTSESRTLEVHWSRLIHVTPDAMESDVYGTPVLKAIYNRLQDLELVSGGSSEMFWRGAFPGISFEADGDVELPSESAMEDEIEDYIHGVSRYLRLQGVKTRTLEPNIVSAKDQINVIISLISGATGIPQRILMGSERGELASTQDKANWEDRVDERRTNFAEPMILRPTIDRFIDLGILPEPKDGSYSVSWPDISALTLEQKSEVAERFAKALKAYIEAGVHEVVPPVSFLVDFMGFERSKAEEMVMEAMTAIEEENDDAAALAEADEEEDEEAAKEEVA
jgi:hypothetical protein